MICRGVKAIMFEPQTIDRTRDARHGRDAPKDDMFDFFRQTPIIRELIQIYHDEVPELEKQKEIFEQTVLRFRDDGELHRLGDDAGLATCDERPY